MNDTPQPASMPIDVTRVLYGADPLEGIVAVEPVGPDRMRLFVRNPADGATETCEERFEPWLLAERGEPWSTLWSKPTVDPLDGDHAYRYLVTFRDWSSLLDAARATSDAGERFFRLRSPVEQHLVRNGHTLFKGMTFDALRRLQIDIETTGFDASDPASEVIVIALSGPNGAVETLWAEAGEADLIERAGERIRAIDPDAIEGHNLFNFDLPFLAARAARHGLALLWGRDGSALRLGVGVSRFKAGPLTMPYTPAFVHGRHIIDTYQQIQRYDIGGKLTSYGLKQAVDELGLTRSDREFVPGERIAEVWRADRDRLLRYAGDDVRDVDTLSRLATPTEFYQTQLLPRGYQAVATGGPGEKLNDLMLRAYLMHGWSVPAAERPREYPGGHAELLERGVFRPVVKCDVESLYPSIMLSEGITSSRDSLGVYLPMLADLTSRRLEAKARSRASSETTTDAERAMWEGMQGSFKVLINSFYGYLGYSGGLFNDFDAAERVTLAGQRIVKDVVSRLRERGATPIEVDTDGVYFVPPPDIATKADEEQFIEDISVRLPAGIRLAHDGRFAAMLSLKLKTYALLTERGAIGLKGSALRSRRMEPCLRWFLVDAASRFLNDDQEGARNLYFDLAARIRERRVEAADIAQWGMINEETLSKFPRLERLLSRAANLPHVRPGERVQFYERKDGELGLIEEWNHDENAAYLLRRLRDVAERFRPLFAADAEFEAFFPAVSARTNLQVARAQAASQQLTLFG